MASPRVLIPREELAARVEAMGREIALRHDGHELVFVVVLKGSFVFAADLVRAVDRPCRVEFLGVRSYGAETTTSGVVQITHDLDRSIEGARVILVEDIVDTGLTMAYLLDNLRTRRPASLEVAALLQKPGRARVRVPIEYLGFTIDDAFVVGYGLDHAELHRNLPYLGVVETP